MEKDDDGESWVVTFPELGKSLKGLNYCPEFLLKTFRLLRSECQTDGLFRRVPDEVVYERIFSSLIVGESLDLRSVLDVEDGVHVITKLTKQYFRTLPEPIFPEPLHYCFVLPSYVAETPSRLQLCRILVHLVLPRLPHFQILRSLFSFLNDFSEASNLMDARNLGIVFAPNLLRTGDRFRNIRFCKNGMTMIQFFIEFYKEIFLNEITEEELEIGKLLCELGEGEESEEGEEEESGEGEGEGEDGGEGEGEAKVEVIGEQRSAQPQHQPETSNPPESIPDSTTPKSDTKPEAGTARGHSTGNSQKPPPSTESPSRSRPRAVPSASAPVRVVIPQHDVTMSQEEDTDSDDDFADLDVVEDMGELQMTEFAATVKGTASAAPETEEPGETATTEMRPLSVPIGLPPRAPGSHPRTWDQLAEIVSGVAHSRSKPSLTQGEIDALRLPRIRLLPPDRLSQRIVRFYKLEGATEEDDKPNFGRVDALKTVASHTSHTLRERTQTGVFEDVRASQKRRRENRERRKRRKIRSMSLSNTSSAQKMVRTVQDRLRQGDPIHSAPPSLDDPLDVRTRRQSTDFRKDLAEVDDLPGLRDNLPPPTAPGKSERRKSRGIFGGVKKFFRGLGIISAEKRNFRIPMLAGPNGNRRGRFAGTPRTRGSNRIEDAVPDLGDGLDLGEMSDMSDLTDEEGGDVGDPQSGDDGVVGEDDEDEDEEEYSDEDEAEEEEEGEEEEEEEEEEGSG